MLLDQSWILYMNVMMETLHYEGFYINKGRNAFLYLCLHEHGAIGLVHMETNFV